MNKTDNDEKKGKRMTFWQFLRENSCQIPVVQRDYAQGRRGAKDIRKDFLGNLKNALENCEKLQLDFVYGSTKECNFQPIDGQQRLTTLWLLHWFIALHAEREKFEDACKTLGHFSYETRTSSLEFCQQLCNPQNFETFKATDKAGDYILDSSWFHSTWLGDPTIDAMLRMLRGTGKNDGIEEAFATENEAIFQGYLEKLQTDADNCPIIFYEMPLEEFGLTDELYIKMNHRGKQLTPYENFKAGLVGYIKEQNWDDLMDAKNGIPIKLDRDWTDIFWTHKRKADSSIDEIYYAFLCRFFLNYKITYLKDEKDEYYRFLRDAEGQGSYTSIDHFKWKGNSDEGEGTIDKELLKSLAKVLDNYKASKVNEEIFRNPYEESSDFQFIPQYNKEGKLQGITQKQRVVFSGLCRYFEKGVTDEPSLQRWVRFLWNIASAKHDWGGDVTGDFSEMQKAAEIIRLVDPHNVYESLQTITDIDQKIIDNDRSGTKLLAQQLKEEIEKARLILDDATTWEQKILAAEKTAFFCGSIGFLLRGENGEWQSEFFDVKLKNAKKYFCEQGVTDEYFIGEEINPQESGENYQWNATNAAKLLRRLLTLLDFNDGKHIEDYWITLDRTASSWRASLRKSELYKVVHQLLLKDDVLDFDYSHFEPKGISAQDERYAVEALVRTKMINYFVEGCYVQRHYWLGGPYYVHPYNAKASWKYYFLHPRTDLLLSSNRIDFPDENRKHFRECRLLWGYAINFTFGGRNFQWDTPSGDATQNGKIYLMNGDWSERRNKEINVACGISQDDFFKMLDALIEETAQEEEQAAKSE